MRGIVAGVGNDRGARNAAGNAAGAATGLFVAFAVVFGGGGVAAAGSNEVGIGGGLSLGVSGGALPHGTPATSAGSGWRPATGERRTVAPGLELRSDLVPSVTFQAGPLISLPAAGAAARPPLVGGFAGMVFNDGTLPGATIGVDLQGMQRGPDGGTRFEVGAAYAAPVTEAWQFSARLSSGFASDAATGLAGGGSRGGLDAPDGESGFRDVGLGVGLDYDFADRWRLETSLGYTRLIGDPHRRSVADEEARTHQFFGGVVVNYRF
ncbi:MAG: MipA/OmpV family protein [Rhodospirillales bacterium]